jgi:hypothetical protein
MAEQLPESAFERMTADERAKERVERQKVLVGIPRGTLLQKYHAFTAELSVELQESLEDLLVTANALPGELAEAQTAKVRVIQAGRASLEKANRAIKILYVAAKEGGDAAQRIFNPEPTFAGMNDEEVKILDKIRKEREQAKKKESEASKTGWKGLGKRPAPYSCKLGFGGYGGGYGGGFGGGFGGGAADLNSWALQQLLAQQLGNNKGEGAKASSGGGQPPAAAGSSGRRVSPTTLRGLPWLVFNIRAMLVVLWATGRKTESARQRRGGPPAEKDGGTGGEGERGRRQVRDVIYVFTFYIYSGRNIWHRILNGGNS